MGGGGGRRAAALQPAARPRQHLTRQGAWCGISKCEARKQGERPGCGAGHPDRACGACEGYGSDGAEMRERVEWGDRVAEPQLGVTGMLSCRFQNSVRVALLIQRLQAPWLCASTIRSASRSADQRRPARGHQPALPPPAAAACPPRPRHPPPTPRALQFASIDACGSHGHAGQCGCAANANGSITSLLCCCEGFCHAPAGCHGSRLLPPRQGLLLRRQRWQRRRHCRHRPRRALRAGSRAQQLQAVTAVCKQPLYSPRSGRGELRTGQRGGGQGRGGGEVRGPAGRPLER